MASSFWDDELVYEFIDFYDDLCKNKPTWKSEAAEKFRKLKQQQRKLPLFRTEDGKEVYEGDKVWWIEVGELDWHWCPHNATADKLASHDAIKYFSTEAAAKEYVLMNKPCLSLKDVMEFYITHKFAGEQYSIFNHSALKEFVESKSKP